MKKSFLVAIIFAMLTSLASAHEPARARVAYAPNGGQIETPASVMPKIIDSLTQLPEDCVAHAEEIMRATPQGMMADIDCGTGRFHLQASDSRSRASGQSTLPPGIPASAPDGTPILQVQYNYSEEAGIVTFENENYYGMIWGIIKKENGQIIGRNMFIVDKKTGVQTLSTVDIKITHWAELAETLGIVAETTTPAGGMVFWAPGIIIAANQAEPIAGPTSSDGATTQPTAISTQEQVPMQPTVTSTNGGYQIEGKDYTIYVWPAYKLSDGTMLSNIAIMDHRTGYMTTTIYNETRLSWYKTITSGGYTKRYTAEERIWFPNPGTEFVIEDGQLKIKNF